MNPEQMKKIVNGAPHGATHIDSIGYYFMKTDDGYFIYSKVGYGWSSQPSNFTDSEIALYEIKPL